MRQRLSIRCAGSVVLPNQRQIIKLIFAWASIQREGIDSLRVHYILLIGSASGGRMMIALLVAGILALAITGGVILSALQDIADDY